MHGTKRSAEYTGSGTTAKRRAQYALKACDTCRKRKGKCDGNHPCRHCQVRQLDCVFSDLTREDRNDSTAARQTPGMPQQQHLQGFGSDLSGLSGLVTSMQGQIEALAAQIRDSNRQTSIPQSSQAPSLPRSQPLPTPGLARRAISSSPLPTQVVKRLSRRFCGPTSAEYSLNAAWLKFRPTSRSAEASQLEIDVPSLIEDSDQSDLDDDIRVTAPNVSKTQNLCRFRFMFTKARITALLRIYSEVIGDYHPIVDVVHIQRLVDRSYKAQSLQQLISFREDEDDLLILNLALTIALCAESAAQPDSHAQLLATCRQAFGDRVACTGSDLKSVKIVLMMGFYHFFSDDLPASWRLCGLAGRMCMELGLHSSDHSQLHSKSEAERAEAAVLVGSVIVLDRQWSASTGLPIHFPSSTFDKTWTEQIETPYLKSMLAFTLISENFAGPISVVASGGIYNNNDEYEVLALQLDQWKKKALHGQHSTHPLTWSMLGTATQPSWKILLYLRTNAVRCLLLRPFFLSRPSAKIAEVGRDKVQSALDLVSDTIDTLALLDSSTNAYRQQHPHFYHILATACALLFLVVVHLGERKDRPLMAEMKGAVARNFHGAEALAGQYRETFRASRRLWKRLCAMRTPLVRLGLLDDGGIRGLAVDDGTRLGSAAGTVSPDGSQGLFGRTQEVWNMAAFAPLPVFHDSHDRLLSAGTARELMDYALLDGAFSGHEGY